LGGRGVGAEAEVPPLSPQAERTRQLLRDQAVEAYIRGSVPAVATDSDVDPSRMQAYIDAVTSQRRDALDAMRQAVLALSEQQEELAAARTQARAALAEMDASRRAAEAATAAQRATLGRVQGELAALVDAETRRRAEADARRAQEAAAARTARDQQSATQATTRSTTPTGATATTARPRTAAPVEPTGPAPGPPASGASAAVAKAKEQIGKPYEYGAAGPDSFDCSGLTQYAWKAGGKSLPHSSRSQYSSTTRVSTSDLLPGDLLFYGSPIHHVGIYVGNGQMVEASQTGTPVRYASIWRSDMVGAGRVY
jgi:peptidoglycan DL-endopeptidase CwlO